jgi:hypothetical protein
MPVTLQIDNGMSAEAQSVKDRSGTASALSLSTGAVVIGATTPKAELVVGGNLYLERSGSPRIDIESHGYGTQHYSLRVTNRTDPSGERRFIIRNESHRRDEIVLDNEGNVTFTGDVILSGADCAEDFDAVDPQSLVPGTVVSIGSDARLRMSTTPYDRCVAGVVAGAGDLRAGIVLGRRAAAATRVPVALLGRAWCNVDASIEPIRVGDLLTTAARPGHAMKASNSERAFGAVIGKALDQLEDGSGMVRVLLALQ